MPNKRRECISFTPTPTLCPHPVSLCIRNRLDLHFWQLQLAVCPSPPHPIRLERCYHYLLAAHKQLALLAIGMPQHAKVSSHFSFVFSHPHPIPFAVAALRLADCMRLHFWKFGIRCEQKRTQVSNIWLIWIGTNCFWFTEALQDVSNEHKIWFNPPHPRCSMGHTNATTLW